MADVAEATTTPAEMAELAAAESEAATPETAQASESITFGGTTRNLVPGMAMLLGAVLAFMMGMTDVFFAEAMAWTFAIWGALLIYAGLLDIYETYEVTDDALVIRNAMRPWSRGKTWAWADINRLEVVTRRKDWKLSNAKMQVYHSAEGELGIDREDRAFDPALTGIIIERAGLRAAGADNPDPLDALPLEQDAMYTWQ